MYWTFLLIYIPRKEQSRYTNIRKCVLILFLLQIYRLFCSNLNLHAHFHTRCAITHKPLSTTIKGKDKTWCWKQQRSLRLSQMFFFFFYFVTWCMAWAKYSTFLDVTPATDIRPSFVKKIENSLVSLST